MPAHIRKPTVPDCAAVCGSSPASEAVAATTVEADMPAATSTVCFQEWRGWHIQADPPADISTVCLQEAPRMDIQVAILSTISAVITMAEATGDPNTTWDRPIAD